MSEYTAANRPRAGRAQPQGLRKTATRALSAAGSAAAPVAVVAETMPKPISMAMTVKGAPCP